MTYEQMARAGLRPGATFAPKAARSGGPRHALAPVGEAAAGPAAVPPGPSAEPDLDALPSGGDGLNHSFARLHVHADGRAPGAGLAGVRVHTESARATQLGARAFAQGIEIHVAPGQWAPDTAAGRALLGHELGHVLQQRAGRVPRTAQLAGAAVNDDPALEREADALGRSAAQSWSRATAPAAGQEPAGDAAARGGVIQRTPVAPPDPATAVHEVLHALTLNGPLNSGGGFTEAFRVLDQLSTPDLLTALTDLAACSQLEPLIFNASATAPFNHVRLVTAMEVVRLVHAPVPDLQLAQTTIMASAMAAYEQLAMNNYVLAARPPVPTTRSPDQRVTPPGPAAALPSADLAREIGYELDPSSRPAPPSPVPAGPPGAPPPPPPPPPARTPWDGRTGAKGATKARKKMQRELFKAFDAYLKFCRADTLAALAQPRVPFTTPAPAAASPAPAATGVVDIANQARAVLEARYATSMDAAASTAAQVSDRAVRQASGPGQNIYDVSSEADRATMTGSTDLAPAVAWWLFENDVPGATDAAGSRDFATDILARHHYSPQDPGAEQFRWDVAYAYAAASTLVPNNRRQLIEYRMTGWSERGTRGITLQSSYDPGSNPNRAQLEQRWSIFGTATHESLHLRAHPAFVAAEQGRGTMTEGFTEMFTIDTLNTDVLPRARAGSLEPLRHTVEGALSPATPDATLIINRSTPAQYVPHWTQAERIRAGGTPPGGTAHAAIGEAAVRAAFFQGHVEYLGLAPGGAQLPTLPAAGAPIPIRIPGGITNLNDLAARSAVPRATIVADNPGITDALPATAVLGGCREHWVIAGETRAKIAAQHGVSQADLVRANPDIPTDLANEWPALTAGQKILIPKH